MFDESVITILFRLINFAALLGLFYYIFTKYLLADIKADIKKQEEEVESKKESIIQLEDRGNQLSQQLLDQEKSCHQLLERVNHWRGSFERDLEHKKRDLEELREKTEIQQKRRQEAMAHKKLMSVVVSKALEKVERDEIKYFSHEQAHASYVHEIIAHVQKS